VAFLAFRKHLDQTRFVRLLINKTGTYVHDPTIKSYKDVAVNIYNVTNS
jgi:hypothetical protein